MHKSSHQPWYPFIFNFHQKHHSLPWWHQLELWMSLCYLCKNYPSSSSIFLQTHRKCNSFPMTPHITFPFTHRQRCWLVVPPCLNRQGITTGPELCEGYSMSADCYAGMVVFILKVVFVKLIFSKLVPCFFIRLSHMAQPLLHKLITHLYHYFLCMFTTIMQSKPGETCGKDQHYRKVL